MIRDLARPVDLPAAHEPTVEREPLRGWRDTDRAFESWYAVQTGANLDSARSRPKPEIPS